MIPILVIFVFALTAILCFGMAALRRKNTEIARLRHPVTPMRFRHLNVVNRCDGSIACLSKAHEPTCIRGRQI